MKSGKLSKHAELQGWTDHDKHLQFELHLTGKAESVHEVLPATEKDTFAHALSETFFCRDYH